MSCTEELRAGDCLFEYEDDTFLHLVTCGVVLEMPTLIGDRLCIVEYGSNFEEPLNDLLSDSIVYAGVRLVVLNNWLPRKGRVYVQRMLAAGETAEHRTVHQLLEDTVLWAKLQHLRRQTQESSIQLVQNLLQLVGFSIVLLETPFQLAELNNGIWHFSGTLERMRASENFPKK